MYYSPLRYPGGKGKLAPFMKLILDKLGMHGGTYIEPFAGGAGIALDLLLTDTVDQIVINDLDKGIYSFWRAILNDTNRFIDRILNTDLSIDEWNKQKQIAITQNRYSFELGFAIFYLNRTNRSGIIKGGVIGGTDQKSEWKMDARFNRNELSRRIQQIALRKKDIILYNKDVGSLIVNYLNKFGEETFIYFDPPYFNKGNQLYLNYFNAHDHQRLHDLIQQHCIGNWIVTYDDVPEIKQIYREWPMRTFDLNYSVAKKRTASEIMFFQDIEMCPSNEQIDELKISINLR